MSGAMGKEWRVVAPRAERRRRYLRLRYPQLGCLPREHAPQIDRRVGSRFRESEGDMNFATHLIAIPADGRAQMYMCVRDETPETSDATRQNPGGNAAPPGVQCRNHAGSLINNEDGYAIGYRNGEERADDTREMAVGVGGEQSAIRECLVTQHMRAVHLAAEHASTHAGTLA
jgi:hypothetical protein